MPPPEVQRKGRKVENKQKDKGVPKPLQIDEAERAQAEAERGRAVADAWEEDKRASRAASRAAADDDGNSSAEGGGKVLRVCFDATYASSETSNKKGSS